MPIPFNNHSHKASGLRSGLRYSPLMVADVAPIANLKYSSSRACLRVVDPRSGIASFVKLTGREIAHSALRSTITHRVHMSIMRKDHEVSLPPTTHFSTKRTAQLRPVRLDPSAYSSSGLSHYSKSGGTQRGSKDDPTSQYVARTRNHRR
jgi:hypothetical protein